MKMETIAKLRNLRMSPRKVRLMTDLVKGKNVDEALLQLALKPRVSALPVKKLIESAVANAVHNHSMNIETLVIKNTFVDGGATLKRFTPRAFGRASAIHKRTSHVTVILEGEVDEKLATSKLKVSKKQEESHEGHDHSHESLEKELTEEKNAPEKKPKKRITKK